MRTPHKRAHLFVEQWGELTLLGMLQQTGVVAMTPAA